jgi:hypothetical protein
MLPSAFAVEWAALPPTPPAVAINPPKDYVFCVPFFNVFMAPGANRVSSEPRYHDEKPSPWPLIRADFKLRRDIEPPFADDA